jgi:hypothetical protein
MKGFKITIICLLTALKVLSQNTYYLSFKSYFLSQHEIEDSCNYFLKGRVSRVVDYKPNREETFFDTNGRQVKKLEFYEDGILSIKKVTSYSDSLDIDTLISYYREYAPGANKPTAKIHTKTIEFNYKERNYREKRGYVLRSNYDENGNEIKGELYLAGKKKYWYYEHNMLLREERILEDNTLVYLKIKEYDHNGHVSKTITKQYGSLPIDRVSVYKNVVDKEGNLIKIIDNTSDNGKDYSSEKERLIEYH